MSIVEPGTGELLEVPCTLLSFHEEELVNHSDAALASEFFSEWAAATGGRHLPLPAAECVGYRVPLFLGGRDTVENLEVIDLDVYWSLCGQLRAGTASLAPGASIESIRISE